MIKISDRPNQRISFRGSYVWIVFLTILAGYALLIIPTLGRLGIGWDEATDFVIAQAYQSPRVMLLGISWDLSQTRLPMLTVALVFHLLGSSNLLLARFTSVLVGGLTLLGVFVYGKDRFNPVTGLVAAGLLAINPFFLSFARLAFTESDIYSACTLIWFLVTLTRFQERPSLGWAVLSGILLSLAISSKATMLVIMPAAYISFFLSQAHPELTADSKVNDLEFMPSWSVWLWSGWAAIIMLTGVLISRQVDVNAHPRILHLFNYSLVCLGWLIILIWTVRRRNSTSSPVALAAFITGFSILTFVIFPPEHLANSGIINTLISRAAEEMAFSPGFMSELAALHVFVIFLKSTPVLGLGLLAGYVFSLAQWRRRELSLPLLVVTTYFSALLFLPLGQTFYTIPLLPVLSLLAADQLLRLVLKWRKVSIALIAPGLILWGVEMKQCYPDYHLNGYQWVGARPLFGRSSIGYRSIVYIPLDGTQQVMEWLNLHAEAGQTAQVYIKPWYIVDAMAPDPVYKLTDGFNDNLASEPDYVVIHIGSSILQGEGSDTPPGDIFRHPFDMETLQGYYDKVFSVQRAFDLEMASVWRRK